VRHHLAWFSLLLALVALAAADEAAAQDQGLDLLLFRSLREDGVPPIDLQAHTVQLYRLPLSLRLRREDEDGWGLRLTFPVSLSSLRIDSVSDVRPFVKKLGVAPEKCLVYEDADLGIEAARRAGMRFIDVRLMP